MITTGRLVIWTQWHRVQVTLLSTALCRMVQSDNCCRPVLSSCAFQTPIHSAFRRLLLAYTVTGIVSCPPVTMQHALLTLHSRSCLPLPFVIAKFGLKVQQLDFCILFCRSGRLFIHRQRAFCIFNGKYCSTSCRWFCECLVLMLRSRAGGNLHDTSCCCPIST